MDNFINKVAVITGAGRGIGRGIALRCAQERMKVVLAGIGLESIVKTAAELQALGTETLVVQTDVSKLEDVEHLAEKCFSTFGSVDLLVNNAGVAVPASVLDSTLDDWKWVMSVNFFGVLYGIRAFVPKMITQNCECHVVNVSSIAGLETGGGSYGVSKHAVVVLTESLFQDLANSAPKVKFSVLCPGWVDTDFYRVDQSRPERFRNNVTEVTNDVRKDWRASLSSGLSIEETAEILFQGLRDVKLYIGPKAFQKQLPDIVDWIQDRAQNMITETNPKL
jgi:NAD(P)-dependent dehydrogenase (short-subunit alcohol dehydrogenase family)